MESNYLIRLFLKAGRPEDHFVDLKEDYPLEEFCGTVPAVGDLILDPGVRPEQDRRDYRNRQLYEVVARYFLPHAHGDSSYVALVVKSRPAQKTEAEIVI